MTSWMKERDRLLEQTLSFVQGVAARRPGASLAAEPVPTLTPAPILVAQQPPASRKIVSDPASVETDALISLMALSQSDARQASPIQPVVVEHEPGSPAAIRVVANQPVYQPAAKRLVDVILPERDAIALRVARFRAGQQKLRQDREDNYTAVQAKIRASLGTDPSA